VRHRIASYSQKSQRYVNEEGFEYIIPPSIEKHPYLKGMFEAEMKRTQEKYEFLRMYLASSIAEDEGISKEAAEKRANEDARFLLPNACETKIVVTMNVRSLFNFFKHRCCNRAQWEIRAVANEMWKQCMNIAPNIFKHAGPECITKGKCPEGKMSCGKPPIMCYGEKSHPVPDKEM
jgi:thymidylate synthase (FAD)